MMSPTLCSRHGAKPVLMASRRVVERANQRENFAPGELVQVSLDRRKHSKQAWMTQAELDEHGVTARAVDGVVHVTEFPVIAALERTWTFVCRCCLDELLVRCGEQPYMPTPVERAFDMSIIADNAHVSGPLIRCEIHGIVLRRVVSPAIAAAMDGREAEAPLKLVRVVIVTPRAENDCWYDDASLRAVLGADIVVLDGVYRVEAGDASQKLLDAGVRVCQRCLVEWLTLQGIELKSDTPFSRSLPRNLGS
jgi:hypothetical protein